MRKVLVSFAAAVAAGVIPLHSSFAQPVELERITVEKTSRSYFPGELDHFSYDTFQDFPLASSEEVIDYSSSIDLHKRSPFSLQQDLSIRGSVFEDAQVTLAGIVINDPQTGHYTLELPVTAADVQAVSVIKNAQEVSFALRKPQRSGGNVRVAFGEHALGQQLLSVNFGLAQVSNRISMEHAASSGGKQDTDFERYSFTSHSLYEGENAEAELFFGLTERDFGAANFYATTFPQEEEHLTQRFFFLRGKIIGESIVLDNTVYFRRHTDQFILNRHNPSFYMNQHKAYRSGGKTTIDFPNSFFVALEAEREKIDSTNLAKHKRWQQGVTMGVREQRISDFFFDFEAGIDYYDQRESLERGHLTVGYACRDDVRVRLTYDRLWRAPSFTELYYTSPSNRGDPDLNTQKADSVELGIDYAPQEQTQFTFDIFGRNQHDTIDWVRNSPTQIWEAHNIKGVRAWGTDVYGKVMFSEKVLDTLSLGYTYLHLEDSADFALSKYVFDYARHKVVAMAGFDVKGVRLNLISTFIRPVQRREYATVDIKVAKAIGDCTVSLEGTNIFNTEYEELADIEGVGRWYRLSLTYSF